MKTSLWLVGATVVTQCLVSACGEEAPPILGTGTGGAQSGQPMPQGTAFPTMPSPGGSGTPVSPGDPQPGMPGELQPGTLQPGGPVGGVVDGTATPPGGATTPPPAGTPLMPPMPGAATTPPAVTTPPAMTTPPATPLPADTPATPADTPAAMCDAAWEVGSSGFVKAPGASSCWQGYAWASATPAAMSSITPEDFSACGADCMLCASGTVAPTDDYSGVALLGFNVAQQESSNTTGTLTPTGSITINFTNTMSSPLRVQLNGTGSNQWCADLTGKTSPVTLALSDFQLECWEGGANTPYASGTIEAIVLLVPGSNTDATDFDICLNSVTPG